MISQVPNHPQLTETLKYKIGKNVFNFEFAYVREAQGTSWLPGSLGGSYYGRGLYMYDGANWVPSNENIYKALEGLTAYTYTNTTYNIQNTDNIVEADGTFTINLPTAVGITGEQFTIKNVGTGTITVDGDNTETIDGNLTAVIAVQNASITVVSNGTNWIII